MTKTEDDLKAAFAGESQANRRYLAFAARAEQDGYPQIAKLFRAAAEAETVHALNHLRVMGGIKGTGENLREAIAGETHEYTKMYPGFIEDAKKEKNKAAEIGFTVANKVEEVHAGLYKKALEAADAKKDMPKKDIHVCQVCGMTVEGDAPDECLVCKAKKDKFKKIV